MLKTRLVVLSIVIVSFMFCTSVAYFKGSADAKEACTNKYEAQIARERYVRMTALGDRLTKLHDDNRKLREEYAELNRQISEGVFRTTETVYRTVEKAVEKPVYVQGDCSISYDDVALVFDAVATATGNN